MSLDIENWENEGGQLAVDSFYRGWYTKRRHVKSKRTGAVFVVYGHRNTRDASGKVIRVLRMYRESDGQEFEMPEHLVEPTDGPKDNE